MKNNEKSFFLTISRQQMPASVVVVIGDGGGESRVTTVTGDASRFPA